MKAIELISVSLTHRWKKKNVIDGMEADEFIAVDSTRSRPKQNRHRSTPFHPIDQDRFHRTLKKMNVDQSIQRKRIHHDEIYLMMEKR
jgi:hypothetical protein